MNSFYHFIQTFEYKLMEYIGIDEEDTDLYIPQIRYDKKGKYDPNVESVIQGGNLTSFGDRACNVLSGVTIPNFFTPMIPRLSNEVQNTQHIIPEDNSEGWVRGGIPSRDVYKLMDYNKRCDKFNKSN